MSPVQMESGSAVQGLGVLREAIEYAPAVGPVAPGLVGVWTESDYYVCAHCVGRIVARGMGHVLGRGQVRVWEGDSPTGVCATCGGSHVS